MSNNHELLNNRYRTIKTLNEETGNTYLGEDTQNGRQVVIKTRRFKNISDWKVLELFEREIDILRQINHPKIPGYIDSFTIEKGQDTEYYLIQEYIEGVSLKEKVIEDRPLTEAETINIIEQLLEILKYLHEFHPPIIHRDINPSNIVITPANEVYLIDFGAVKDILEYNPNNATIVGTYGYMPIEQTMGKSNTSSDLYSLGMTTVFMLTGKNPSKLNIARGKPDIKAYCDISPSFTQTLNLMIEPVMEDRLQSVDEVYNELRLLKLDRKQTRKQINNTQPIKEKQEKKDMENRVKRGEKGKFKKEIEYYEKKYKPQEEDQEEELAPEDEEIEFEEERPIQYLERDPVFRNQVVKRISYRDLELYVDKVYVPPNFNKIKIWKDFDTMTIYFRSSAPSKHTHNRPIIGSGILFIPLIMLFVYIGMETFFLEPFFIFAMIVPLFVLFMRNIKIRNNSSIQLKSNYLKIIRDVHGRPESKIIGYYDIKDIYSKLVDNRRRIVIELKTNNIIEVDTDLSKTETEWIINTCKKFIKIAVNVS
jgi:serine/threonine protein kinase